MKTLSELIDSSGEHLPPLLELIPSLLRATGELETPKLSYISNQLSGTNSEHQEEIDSVRAEVAKQHQATVTLTKCIRYIDYRSFEKMTPEIIDIIKVAVNLGTKIACAHFICLVRNQ